MLRDDTVILCVQNGLGSEDIVKAEVGGRCLVLRAITQFGAIFQEPGVVDFTAAGATLLEPSPRSAEIAALLLRRPASTAASRTTSRSRSGAS